jgi:hypothetical protein
MRYVLPVIAFALLAPAAHAYPELPQALPPVKGNPANKLLDVPIEDSIFRRAADKLIRLLLAPDRAGNPQALARRMGMEGLIDRTAAHQDHIHLGMTRAGAKRRTSFWTAR